MSECMQYLRCTCVYCLDMNLHTLVGFKFAQDYFSRTLECAKLNPREKLSARKPKKNLSVLIFFLFHMGVFFIASELWNVIKSIVLIHFTNPFQGRISNRCASRTTTIDIVCADTRSRGAHRIWSHYFQFWADFGIFQSYLTQEMYFFLL